MIWRGLLNQKFFARRDRGFKEAQIWPDRQTNQSPDQTEIFGFCLMKDKSRARARPRTINIPETGATMNNSRRFLSLSFSLIFLLYCTSIVLRPLPLHPLLSPPLQVGHEEEALAQPKGLCLGQRLRQPFVASFREVDEGGRGQDAAQAEQVERERLVELGGVGPGLGKIL